MVAMPYILVNLVLEILSLILFCTTSTALLSKYRWTDRYVPQRLRNHKTLVFVAYGFVLSVLSLAVLPVVARGRAVFITWQFVFELLFFAALANSVVLTYQFLDGRFLRNAPKVQRRLWIALGAVVMPFAAAIAVVGVVIRLFMIR
jgi:hypothetical protein